MLDSRFDDIKSGKLNLIPSDEVEAYFREKSIAAHRAQSGYEFQPGARFGLGEIWELIRQEDLTAADTVIGEILSGIRAVVAFPH